MIDATPRTSQKLEKKKSLQEPETCKHSSPSEEKKVNLKMKKHQHLKPMGIERINTLVMEAIEETDKQEEQSQASRRPSRMSKLLNIRSFSASIRQKSIAADVESERQFDEDLSERFSNPFTKCSVNDCGDMKHNENTDVLQAKIDALQVVCEKSKETVESKEDELERIDVVPFEQIIKKSEVDVENGAVQEEQTLAETHPLV